MVQRKQYSMQFKFKVALEAAKGLKTVNQIAGRNNCSKMDQNSSVAAPAGNSKRKPPKKQPYTSKSAA